MQTVIWNTLTSAQQQQLLSRPAINAAAGIEASVRDIIAAIRERGDHALMEFSRRFDRFDGEQLRVEQAQIDAASARLDNDIKQAIATAAANIGRFHQAQHSDPIRVETQAGVTCELHTRPISAVGLYVPGGTAPLPSTVMMLAIPARIAGCARKVLCSPPPIADEILYAASVCGVDEIYQVGGAQAVAALAYGTQSINKVDKIFGPGNAYVTEAKRQVSGDHQGAAIDMPAGPSEVLVIADGKANAAFVAADFLSQAEHGVDSQSILVTDCAEFADAVADEIEQQLVQLSRQEIARQALAHSQLIICDDLTQCVAVSNQYAPEHLIIQTENAHALVDAIDHAGSVFVGAWTPESVGDYASGTNHVLPTYGYTRTYSSLGLADFCKRMTVQHLTAAGLQGLGPTVTRIAQAEGLDAHKRAVTIRLEALERQA